MKGVEKGCSFKLLLHELKLPTFIKKKYFLDLNTHENTVHRVKIHFKIAKHKLMCEGGRYVSHSLVRECKC